MLGQGRPGVADAVDVVLPWPYFFCHFISEAASRRLAKASQFLLCTIGQSALAVHRGAYLVSMLAFDGRGLGPKQVVLILYFVSFLRIPGFGFVGTIPGSFGILVRTFCCMSVDMPTIASLQSTRV